jgi:hypothetical protein
VAKAKTEEQEALENGPLNVDDVPKAEAEDRELDPAQQARALAHYRITGSNELGYVDQSRDQEPDIGAEFGQAPHPELFNPEPHESATLLGSAGGHGGLAGIGQKSDSQLVNPSEETIEAREAELQRQLEARENVVAGAVTVAPGPAQPVVVVADQSAENQKAQAEADKAAKKSDSK